MVACGSYDQNSFSHRQVDAATGAPIHSTPLLGRYGHWRITPDRRTLYDGDPYLVPASLISIDVTGTLPVIANLNPPGTSGANCQDVAISHNGEFFAFVVGTGNELGHARDIGLYSTKDQTVVGDLIVGQAYPNQIAFSPDDEFAYVVNAPEDVKVFSTKTNALVDEWHFGKSPDQAIDLIVDGSGSHLFAINNNIAGSHPDNLTVFATGRGAIPEPSTLALAAIAMCTATAGYFGQLPKSSGSKRTAALSH